MFVYCIDWKEMYRVTKTLLREELCACLHPHKLGSDYGTRKRYEKCV
jgi:hypothetical protein